MKTESRALAEFSRHFLQNFWNFSKVIMASTFEIENWNEFTNNNRSKVSFCVYTKILFEQDIFGQIDIKTIIWIASQTSSIFCEFLFQSFYTISSIRVPSSLRLYWTDVHKYTYLDHFEWIGRATENLSIV